MGADSARVRLPNRNLGLNSNKESARKSRDPEPHHDRRPQKRGVSTACKKMYYQSISKNKSKNGTMLRKTGAEPPLTFVHHQSDHHRRAASACCAPNMSTLRTNHTTTPATCTPLRQEQRPRPPTRPTGHAPAPSPVGATHSRRAHAIPSSARPRTHKKMVRIWRLGSTATPGTHAARGRVERGREEGPGTESVDRGGSRGEPS